MGELLPRIGSHRARACPGGLTQREFAAVADRGWGESTTQIVLEPLALFERLARSIPPS